MQHLTPTSTTGLRKISNQSSRWSIRRRCSPLGPTMIFVTFPTLLTCLAAMLWFPLILMPRFLVMAARKVGGGGMRMKARQSDCIWLPDAQLKTRRALVLFSPTSDTTISASHLCAMQEPINITVGRCSGYATSATGIRVDVDLKASYIHSAFHPTSLLAKMWAVAENGETLR